MCGIDGVIYLLRIVSGILHFDRILADLSGCCHFSCGQTLEYAFDFMEGTFGSSQEMVVFITELNSSAPAVRFLQENECERYYEYNKNLLFDEKRADILSRLDRLGAFS